MASFVDASGKVQQVKIEPSIYRAAFENQASVEAFINQQYPTKAGDTPAFEQMCASEGMIAGKDRKFGIRPATMDSILNGSTKTEAGVITREASPVSRILFPAFMMSTIENKLAQNYDMTLTAFDQMVAVSDTINHDRYERAILSFSQPEAARSRAIAQMSEPTSMLSITSSDKSYRITGTSIGMEISDEAVRSTSLDLVTLAMQRQAAVELAEKVDDYILGFYNGDTDLEMAALSTVSGVVMTAQSLDSVNNQAGMLSQKAWVKWLYKNARKRRIDFVITDIDGALAIQNRSGRPTTSGDNATSTRIDTIESVINPMWPDTVKVFITDDASWPANTIMGLDSRYAIHKVTSSSIAYNAAESYAMRRSTKFRIDMGQIAYRLFDDAWTALTLTV